MGKIGFINSVMLNNLQGFQYNCAPTQTNCKSLQKQNLLNFKTQLRLTSSAGVSSSNVNPFGLRIIEQRLKLGSIRKWFRYGNRKGTGSYELWPFIASFTIFMKPLCIKVLWFCFTKKIKIILKKLTLQEFHNKQHIWLFMVSSLLLSDLTRNVYPKNFH